MRIPRSQAGSSKSIILVACSVVILIGLSGALALVRSTSQNKDNAYKDTNINSFEECVEAGNPVQEKHPETCTTKNGKTFTKTFDNKKQF